MYFGLHAEMKDILPGVTLESTSCICPGQNYTCQADGVIRMQWENDAFPFVIDYSLVNPEDRRKTEIEIQQDDLVRVKFTRSMVVEGLANISSILLVTNPDALNGTNITCEISAGVDKNVENASTLCIIGKILLANLWQFHVCIYM